MRRSLSTHRVNAILVFALAVALMAGEAAAGSLGLALSNTGRMSGTVASVDEESREIGVLEGVGHALRRVVFHVGPQCRILVVAEEASLGELKRGAVVAVEYKVTIDRYEALVIEVSARGARAGGGR